MREVKRQALGRPTGNDLRSGQTRNLDLHGDALLGPFVVRDIDTTPYLNNSLTTPYLDN